MGRWSEKCKSDPIWAQNPEFTPENEQYQLDFEKLTLPKKGSLGPWFWILSIRFLIWPWFGSQNTNLINNILNVFVFQSLVSKILNSSSTSFWKVQLTSPKKLNKLSQLEIFEVADFTWAEIDLTKYRMVFSGRWFLINSDFVISLASQNSNFKRYIKLPWLMKI